MPEKHWNDSEFKRTLKPLSGKKNNFVTEPTLLTNNFFERVKLYCQPGNFLWNLWSKLIRRDCIFNNKIISAKTIIDDFIFTSCLIFSAEKFVFVPSVVNYYRVLEESISHTTNGGLAYFRRQIKAMTAAFRHFDEFLSGREFFCQHPDQKYFALNRLWSAGTHSLMQMYCQISVYEFDEVAREEFSDGDNIALMAFAFNVANLTNLRFSRLLTRVDELEKSARQNKAYIAELENFITQSVGKNKE